MKITDFFERAYVINLPERADRRRLMVRELEKAGMPLTPGKVEIFPAIRPASAGDFPSLGARGCFLSHQAILKQALADGLTNVLIMEDDLTISEQFKSNHEAIITQLRQSEWGFVYFGHREEVAEQSPQRLQPYDQPMMTTHFYGINHRIFNRLLGFLDELQRRPGGHPDGGPMHLDGAYSTFRAQNPDIITLIAAPNLGWQRSSRSDVSPGGWYDRLPGFKQIADIARESKNWLKSQLF